MNREATECWRLLFGLVDDFRELAARRNRNMEIAEFANVTVGQMRVLKAIFAFQEKYPDGVMLKQLAEKVNLTPGAASIIVDTLVNRERKSLPATGISLPEQPRIFLRKSHAMTMKP